MLVRNMKVISSYYICHIFFVTTITPSLIVDVKIFDLLAQVEEKTESVVTPVN